MLTLAWTLSYSSLLWRYPRPTSAHCSTIWAWHPAWTQGRGLFHPISLTPDLRWCPNNPIWISRDIIGRASCVNACGGHRNLRSTFNRWNRARCNGRHGDTYRSNRMKGSTGCPQCLTCSNASRTHSFSSWSRSYPQAAYLQSWSS